MKIITFPKNLIFSSLLFLLFLFGLTSCGSSKQGYASDDGIYGSDTGQEVVMVRDSKTEYYKQYFEGERELSEQIFTDIDAYKGYDEQDTTYVEDDYYMGNPPWEYSDTKVTVTFNMGFGGYYGWGYPYNGWGWGYNYNGWGWGYPYYGWGYPYYGWGYPGYAWGYPGWGWGYPGWGYYPPHYHYPPYYGNYTYGKRYAYNTGRFNTRNLYTDNSISSSYRRSSANYSRSSISNYEPRRSSSSANSDRSYRSSSRARSSGYDSGNRSTPSYNNKSYNNSRSYSRPSSSMGRSSSGYRGSSGSMRGSSSGRRSMSYRQLQERENGSNRVFVKQGTRKAPGNASERVSYSRLRETPQFNQIQNSNRTKYAPSTQYGKSSSTVSGSRSVRNSGSSNYSSSSRSSVRSSAPSGAAAPSRPASRPSSSSSSRTN